MLFNRKGQNTAEYAILIGLVVAAAIGMQTFVKRGFQQRVRVAVNDTLGVIIEETIDASNEETRGQFEPDGITARSTRIAMDGTQTDKRYGLGGISSVLSVDKSQGKEHDGREYDYNADADDYNADAD